MRRPPRHRGRGRVLARELIAWINGLAKVHTHEFQSVAFGGLKHINGEEHQYRWVEDTILVRDSASVLVRGSDGSIQQVGTNLEFESDASVAVPDANVQRALRLFGAGESDWRELYKVLEVVEADLGGLQGIEAAGLAPRSRLRVFKQTANSRAALGDAAWHGTESGLPPKDPMTLGEANALVRDLLRSWLALKR